MDMIIEEKGKNEVIPQQDESIKKDKKFDMSDLDGKTPSELKNIIMALRMSNYNLGIKNGTLRGMVKSMQIRFNKISRMCMGFDEIYKESDK